MKNEEPIYNQQPAGKSILPEDFAETALKVIAVVIVILLVGWLIKRISGSQAVALGVAEALTMVEL